MDQLLSSINIDAILSDPLLLTAATLLVIGPILFLISLVKLIRTPSKKDPLFDMAEATEEPFFKEEREEKPEAVAPPPPSEIEPIEEAPKAPTAPIAPKSFIQEHTDMDKTIVMPAGMAEIQGQLEIAFSQIKHLNKKVYELENELNRAGGSTKEQPVAIDLSELKDIPSNPADFMQKLLKLAEHVIVLEKNMARVLAAKSSEAAPTPPKPTAPPAPAVQQKPPIMPL